ncbi:MAG: sulfurtransferase [Saprospiraceae bacterium]|nr:sulfurtransferase [Saprospiraceae bacterium]
MHKTIISTQQLSTMLGQPTLCIVDGRFALADTNAGRMAYEAAHIPGAVYAHLDDDLSGTITAGVTGRHPLPSVEKLQQLFSAWGIDEKVQVVVYDDKGGGIAARLWWMLRWVGHQNVAVLDGGWPKWKADQLPITDEVEQRIAKTFVVNVRSASHVDRNFVESNRLSPNHIIVDSRTAPRYRGEEEPIDPIAGHIEGAINAPFPENLTADGVFKSKEELRERFEALLKGKAPSQATFYCGSGVTACHNLLAMEYAGLEGAKLYPGSWSEWLLQL